MSNFATASPHRVLFMGRWNAARSLMAEAILNARGAGRVLAASAGLEPAGALDPFAENLLRRRNYDLGQLFSKHWRDLADAPREWDVLVWLCPKAAAAATTCTATPCARVEVAWPLADPCAVRAGAEDLAVAYAETYRILFNRIEALLALPLAELSETELARRLTALGSITATHLGARRAA